MKTFMTDKQMDEALRVNAVRALLTKAKRVRRLILSQIDEAEDDPNYQRYLKGELMALEEVLEKEESYLESIKGD